MCIPKDPVIPFQARAVVLKLQFASKPPGGFAETECLAPSPEFVIQSDVGPENSHLL